MKRFVSCRVSWVLLLPVLVSSGALASPAQEGDPASQLPEGKGKSYLQSLCTPCHGLELTVNQRRSPEGWEATVYDMLGRISPGLDLEAEIISEYLSQHFGLEPEAAHRALPDGPETGLSLGAYRQILFNFKAGATEQQQRALLESGREVLAGIPQVVTALVGRVVQSDSEFRFGLVVGLAGPADLQEFQTHPEYQRWMQDSFHPLVSNSSLAEIVAAEPDSNRR